MYRRTPPSIPEAIAELIARVIVALLRWFLRAGIVGKAFGMAIALVATNTALSALSVGPGHRAQILVLVGFICVFATILVGTSAGRR